MESSSRRNFLIIAGVSAFGFSVKPAFDLFASDDSADSSGSTDSHLANSNTELIKNKSALKAKHWAMVIDTRKIESSNDLEPIIEACHKIHNVPHHKNKKHEIKWIWEEEYKHAFPDKENKYLNSGNFIGWSDDIKKILELSIENSADDQLYYTLRFLESLNHAIDTQIVLDYDNDLFFCLNGATNIYSLEKSQSCLMVKNKRPAFIHGNGPPSIKRELNYIGNYICGGYNSIYGYKNMNKL